jgi:hypothetical protein
MVVALADLDSQIEALINHALAQPFRVAFPELRCRLLLKSSQRLIASQ